MPIQVTSDWADDDSADQGATPDPASAQTLTNVSLGGLSFISEKALETEHRVKISVPILKGDSCLIGTVVWCEKSKEGYEIGLKFESSNDVFRLRMIEQICHIEHYRKEVKRLEGREISAEEAAKEWISLYAGDFPAF